MSPSGLIQPNLLNKDARVKDRPDLVVVDEKGEPHIIDVTLSRKPYILWDSAKKLNEDYKLAIQRRLLESIAPVDRTALYVAPFELPSVGKVLDLTTFKNTS